jgi:dGTPase
MIDYQKILSSVRLRDSSVKKSRTILTESESDRGRVLFSPAFRRLQQKAQVFSMEPNAAVRSRLTHSLEVSQIGRYLADEITQLLTDKNLTKLHLGALVNFVEAACLMHDIGNPPFGHFGEAAIQEWFKTHGKKCLSDSMGIEGEVPVTFDQQFKLALCDFEEFDGNPQGLRIVSKLQWNTDSYGLNLTKTTLAAFLKYVRSPLEERTNQPFTKKPGYFLSEKDVVKKVWEEFGYSEKPQRFALAYIMEAADDIAYCVSDLEDSFEKGIIQEATAFPEIQKKYLEKKFSSDAPCQDEIVDVLENMVQAAKNNDFTSFTYTDFRTRLNNSIVRYAAKRYVNMESKIETGELKTLLPEDEPPGAILKVLKDFCRENVYRHEAVQRVELAGYYAIIGLLEQTRPLLSCSRKRFEAALAHENEDEKKKRILLEPKLLRLFPQKYMKVYTHKVMEIKGQQNEDFDEWHARAHLVVDFISGMTDDFAMTTYRTLAGMRL